MKSNFPYYIFYIPRKNQIDLYFHTFSKKITKPNAYLDTKLCLQWKNCGKIILWNEINDFKRFLTIKLLLIKSWFWPMTVYFLFHRKYVIGLNIVWYSCWLTFYMTGKCQDNLRHKNDNPKRNKMQYPVQCRFIKHASLLYNP